MALMLQFTVAAQVWSLALEVPYATGAGEKGKEKKKIEIGKQSHLQSRQKE